MFDVMQQAKNAIESYNAALKVNSANIANMNNPGYKKLGVSFQSIFQKLITQGTAADENQGGTNPKQFGQSMGISQVSVDFSAGETTDGSTADLAIDGQGLFIVSPDAGTSYLYTRNGNFQVDSAGNLTANGLQVYGLDSANNLVAISGLIGSKTNYKWDANGNLLYSNNPSDATSFTSTGFRIALTSFPNPSGLTQAQGTTFATSYASGDPTTPEAPNPNSTVGGLKLNKIEQSNVVYLSETIQALELQRAMSGNLSMVKMASDIISSFISKLG